MIGCIYTKGCDWVAEKYLISAWCKANAALQAERLLLKKNQWVYVPFCESERDKTLIGRRVSELKYLIGGFSDEEKQYLLASNWKKAGD